MQNQNLNLFRPRDQPVYVHLGEVEPPLRSEGATITAEPGITGYLL